MRLQKMSMRQEKQRKCKTFPIKEKKRGRTIRAHEKSNWFSWAQKQSIIRGEPGAQRITKWDKKKSAVLKHT
jgi:hypothetical protein